MAFKPWTASLCVALSAWGIASTTHAQTADTYPSRPITMVVPAAPGGGTDVVARVMADLLGRRLGQQVVVDNKTGASGMIGTQAVARSAPDGYTVLLAYSTPVFYTHHIFPKVPYNIQKDFAFVTQISSSSLLLLVNSSLPVKNMKEFMDWAKSNKGKVNYGSYGQGSAGHLISAYLSDANKLEMSHVAYKSEAPFQIDLAAGVVPWGLGTLAAAKGTLSAGKIRPIAVMGPKRLAALPDVPTMAEQGFPDPEYNTVAWFTLLAPAATPKPILEKLEKEAVAVLHSPEMKSRMAAIGQEDVPGGSEQFRKDFQRVDPLVKKLVDISGAREKEQ